MRWVTEQTRWGKVQGVVERARRGGSQCCLEEVVGELVIHAMVVELEEVPKVEQERSLVEEAVAEEHMVKVVEEAVAVEDLAQDTHSIARQHQAVPES